jgi:hypothetical protein
MKKPTMDRLTGQLYHLPFIIGQMGLSIANAQKAFNVDYVENVTKILALIDRTLGDADEVQAEKAQAVAALLEALAPSRYQFTEATLDFSADLAETLDVAGSAGLGFGSAAITVNAALTLGYGYDYRAAARITAKLHAIPANPELGKALIERAREIHSDKMTLPELSEVEKEIWDGVAGIYAALTDSQAKTVEAVPPGGG